MEDFVAALGFLPMGTRLKRLGERMQAGVQTHLDAHGFELQSAQFPLLAGLDRQGPMTISELAAGLGVTQPGVTRMILQLEARGLVERSDERADKRFKTVRLTAAGRQMMERAKTELFPAIAAAVADICGGDEDLLERLTRMEAAMAEISLPERIVTHAFGERAEA